MYTIRDLILNVTFHILGIDRILGINNSEPTSPPPAHQGYGKPGQTYTQTIDLEGLDLPPGKGQSHRFHFQIWASHLMKIFAFDLSEESLIWKDICS